MRPLRAIALAVAASALLAACGTTAAAPESASDAASQQTAPSLAPSSDPSDLASEAGQPATAADDAAPAEDSPAKALPEVAPDSLVPAVDVLDVRSGETVNLGSIVPSDRPVLLWAWAPHCPSCRAEAGDLEAFAAGNQDRLTVVGIGTQDDLDYARGFLKDTGVKTPRMLWDPSFESWLTIGITSQPTWILVRGDGSFIDGWVGALPEERILELLDA